MKELLKWVTALGVGVATAALGYASAHAGDGTAMLDPTLSVVAVTILKRGVDWLMSKFGPAPTSTPSTTSR